MKLERTLIVCVLVIVFAAGSVFAQGMIYTFQGQTTSESGSAGLINDSALYPNQPFNFVVSVFPSQAGTFVDSNGVTHPINSLSDPAFPGLYENAFLVGFQSGSRLWSPVFAGFGFESTSYGGVTTPIQTFPVDPQDPNSPIISVTNAPLGLLLMSGSQADGSLNSWVFKVTLTAGTLDAANPLHWQIGQTLAVVNTAFLNGNFSRIRGTVTLVDISDVPEPGVFTLLVFMAILVGTFRAFSKKKLLD